MWPPAGEKVSSEHIVVWKYQIVSVGRQLFMCRLNTPVMSKETPLLTYPDQASLFWALWRWSDHLLYRVRGHLCGLETGAASANPRRAHEIPTAAAACAPIEEQRYVETVFLTLTHPPYCAMLCSMPASAVPTPSYPQTEQNHHRFPDVSIIRPFQREKHTASPAGDR